MGNIYSVGINKELSAKIDEQGWNMPKLLYFIPCMAVSSGTWSATTSLITVLEEISAFQPERLPGDGEEAWLDVKFQVDTLWLKEDGDDDRKFEYLLSMIGPHGNELLSSSSEFAFLRIRPRLRATMSISGIPAIAGILTLRLQYREITRGNLRPWSNPTDFPVEVNLS